MADTADAAVDTAGPAGDGADGGAGSHSRDGQPAGMGDGAGGRGDVIGTLRRETLAARALLTSMADILDGDPELIDSAVAGETDLEEAMDAAVRRLMELDGLTNGIAGLMAGLKDRGERLEKQRDLIRECLVVAMEVAGRRKIETALATIFLRATPPKVEITDEQQIPRRFWKQPEPRLDKRALLDALKAKDAIPGALLSNGGVTLQIKVD